jgi:fucose 4-O-acetylase-like acetyltransferase
VRSIGPAGKTPSPKHTPRLDWMDCLRGISIVLIVVVHANQIAAMHTGGSIPAVIAFNNVFGPLRMPIMVFLSGLFVPRSIAKGAGTYFSGKVRSVAYPYFLWSGLMIALFYLASATIGWKVQDDLVARVFYAPIEHLWFLAYLFLYFVLAYLLRRVSPMMVAPVFMAAAFLPVGGDWEKFWYLASFFMLGVAAARYPTTWARLTRSPIAATALLVVPLATLSAMTLRWIYLPGDLIRTALVLSVLIGAAGVFMRVAHAAPFAPMRYIGRNSLIFYIVHWPAIIFSVPILLRFKWLPMDKLFIFAFVVGLVGPLIITEVTKRSAIAQALFSAPRGWFVRTPGIKPKIPR